MPPIRRYLRITKFSVLECRIYLDNPALAQSWLLNSRDQVLPRVIEAVRPLVLPKLREERERERSKKKNKKRSIKDVVTAGGLQHPSPLFSGILLAAVSEWQCLSTVLTRLYGILVRRLRSLHLPDGDGNAALAPRQAQALPGQDADEAHV